MTRFALTTIALLTLLAAAASAQDWDSYEISPTEIRDGIWWMRGVGGNVVMSAGDDGALLVDGEYEQMGENVRRRMAVEQTIELLEHVQPASPPAALPAITFTDSLTLRFNGEEIVVFHPAPAHTDGDAIVHFLGANVIHAGDVYFNCGYPFIDTSCGGRIDGVIDAVDAILALCDDETVIVPGHGPLADRADLKTYRGVLAGFRDAIAPLKAAGMSLEEAQAAGATAEIDALWGDKMFPPDLFTSMVYLTLDP